MCCLRDLIVIASVINCYYYCLCAYWYYYILSSDLVFTLPVGETKLETLNTEIEEEIAKVRDSLISEKDYQKLQNKFQTRFVNANSSVEGIAGSLATYYMLYGDTDLINEEIEIYRSITREEMKEVANKYLKPNQRAVIDYLPGEAQEQ